MKSNRRELFFFFLIAFGWMLGINLPRLLAAFEWIIVSAFLSTPFSYPAVFGPGVVGFIMTGVKDSSVFIASLFHAMGNITGAVFPYWTTTTGRYVSFLIFLLPAVWLLIRWLNKSTGAGKRSRWSEDLR